MRVLMLAAASVMLTAMAFADDKVDRERRVRVALALAGGAPTPEACGQCREDVAEARADGLKEGKPVVLFVGGCPGEPFATAVKSAGGIPAKTTEYAGDDRPKGERRVVILEPKPDKSGFLRVEVPSATTPAELKAKVQLSMSKTAALPVMPVKELDWSF